MIQTDAPINPGNSGGALANRNGRGHRDQRRRSTARAARTTASASPSRSPRPRQVADKITSGSLARPRPRSASASRSRPRRCSAGAYVAEVAAGSAAEKAGIQVGDVIVAVDGTPSSSARRAPRPHRRPSARRHRHRSRSQRRRPAVEVEVTLGSRLTHQISGRPNPAGDRGPGRSSPEEPSQPDRSHPDGDRIPTQRGCGRSASGPDPAAGRSGTGRRRRDRRPGRRAREAATRLAPLMAIVIILILVAVLVLLVGTALPPSSRPAHATPRCSSRRPTRPGVPRRSSTRSDRGAAASGRHEADAELARRGRRGRHRRTVDEVDGRGRRGRRGRGAAAGRGARVRPRFRDRLGKARSRCLGATSARSCRAAKIDGRRWDELEEALIRADVGRRPTTELLDDLRARVKERGHHRRRRAARRAQGRAQGPPGRASTCDLHLAEDGPIGVAVRRGERRRQDHHHRQARQAGGRRGRARS